MFNNRFRLDKKMGQNAFLLKFFGQVPEKVDVSGMVYFKEDVHEVFDPLIHANDTPMYAK